MFVDDTAVSTSGTEVLERGQQFPTQILQFSSNSSLEVPTGEN